MAKQGLHPLVLGATAAAVLSALGTRAGRMDHDGRAPRLSSAPVAVGVNGFPAPCASGTLPEGPVCLRIPSLAEGGFPKPLQDSVLVDAPREAAPVRGESAQRDSDLVPRRPDRPADPAVYVFPVEGTRVLPGNESPPRPGVRVAVRPGEVVRALALSGQRGPTRVVFVGEGPSPVVATAHDLEVGGRTRSVILIHEGLDHVAKGVVRGAEIAAGAELGAARRELDGGLLTLYVEARELREASLDLDAGVDGVGNLDAGRLTDIAASVPTDVRNVLPLR